MWCSRCGKEGKVLKWQEEVPGKKLVLWVCGECDNVWEDPHLISPDNLGIDRGTFLEERGVFDKEAISSVLGDFWLIWYEKETQRYVGKYRLPGIKFAEFFFWKKDRGVVGDLKLEGIELQELLAAMGIVQKMKEPTDRLYTSVSTLNPKKKAIFQRYVDFEIDLSKYYYFVEFDSEVDGKITAESENYPAIFVPRQPLGFFEEE